MAGNHFINGYTCFRQSTGVFVKCVGKPSAAFLQPFEMAAQRGVDGCARFIDLAQVFLQRPRNHAAAFGQLLHLVGYGSVDLGAALGEPGKVFLHRRRHLVAAFGELHAVVLDGLFDARTGFRKPLDVGIEGARHRMARCFHAAGEIAGAGFEHGRSGRDDVGHVGADLGLALVDKGNKRIPAIRERAGNLAGALDQCLVDLAGARFQGGVELLRAGVQCLGAGLELADQLLAALGKRALDARKRGFELGTQRARRAA